MYALPWLKVKNILIKTFKQQSLFYFEFKYIKDKTFIFFYEQTRNEEVYDKYGDSFIIDVDKEGFKDFLKDLSKEGMDEDEEVEVVDLKNKLKDRLIEIYHVFK